MNSNDERNYYTLRKFDKNRHSVCKHNKKKINKGIKLMSINKEFLFSPQKIRK